VDQEFSVCLWDLANGRALPFPAEPLWAGWSNLAFYPDSDHLTFVTAKRMIETRDAHTAQRVFTLGHGEAGATASPDGRWLMAGKESDSEALWSSQTRSRVFSLPSESGPIWSQALSPDGERLAVGLADGGLAIWNLPRIQAQLAEIGLAWRAEAHPPEQQRPRVFVPALTLDRNYP
jgi:WD40 repeat protein